MQSVDISEIHITGVLPLGWVANGFLSVPDEDPPGLGADVATAELLPGKRREAVFDEANNLLHLRTPPLPLCSLKKSCHARAETL